MSLPPDVRVPHTSEERLLIRDLKRGGAMPLSNDSEGAFGAPERLFRPSDSVGAGREDALELIKFL
jgi:hypothetical protein